MTDVKSIKEDEMLKKRIDAMVLNTWLGCLITEGKEPKEQCRGGVCIGFHKGFIVCKNLKMTVVSESARSSPG